MNIRKGAIVIGGLMITLLVLRAGEYVVDYLFGDQDGKMTGAVLAPGLSFLYGALIIAIIVFVILRIVLVLRGIQWCAALYSSVTEKFCGISDSRLQVSIFILAIIAYAVQSYAFPLFPGRDYSTYLAYYFDYFSKEPVYHFHMVYRTPVAPLIVGLSLQYGGSVLLEVLMALCYAFSAIAVYHIGLLWNRTIAVGAAILLLVYPAYALLYHQVSSEALFAFGFISWGWYIAKTYASPSVKKFVINAIIVFLLTLTRPTGQLGILFVAFPFLLPALPIRKRLQYSFAFLIPCVFLMLLWSLHNYIRYDDFAISRGSGALVPFSRLFMRDKLIKPDNGQESFELARAIQSELLPKEPYKSYGITAEDFFSPRYNSRMWSDLVSLSDRVWGWDSDYRQLRAVSLEAIKKYPYRFAKNMIRDYYLAFNAQLHKQAPKKKHFSHLYAPPPPKLDEQGLLVPTEGQEIPRAYAGWQFSSPNNSMTPDPDSIELKFPPEQQKRLDALDQKMRKSVPRLPVRDGNDQLVDVLNTLLSYFPKMFYWALLSIIGCIFSRDTRRNAYSFLLFMAFTIIGVTYLAAAEGPIPHFRVPLDPFFLLGGLVAGARLVNYGLYLVGERT